MKIKLFQRMHVSNAHWYFVFFYLAWLGRYWPFGACIWKNELVIGTHGFELPFYPCKYSDANISFYWGRVPHFFQYGSWHPVYHVKNLPPKTHTELVFRIHFIFGRFMWEWDQKNGYSYCNYFATGCGG